MNASIKRIAYHSPLPIDLPRRRGKGEIERKKQKGGEEEEDKIE